MRRCEPAGMSGCWRGPPWDRMPPTNAGPAGPAMRGMAAGQAAARRLRARLDGGALRLRLRLRPFLKRHPRLRPARHAGHRPLRATAFRRGLRRLRCGAGRPVPPPAREPQNTGAGAWLLPP